MYGHELGSRLVLAAGAMSRMKLSIELVVEGRVDGIRWGDREKRIAVRRCPHDRFGSDIAASARAVFDDEWLPEPLRKPLTDQACEHVIRGAGGKRNDDAHRPCRIGLRPGDPRQGREPGSGRCQMQKLPAGKFHGLSYLRREAGENSTSVEGYQAPLRAR